jgi:hypothetical protein
MIARAIEQHGTLTGEKWFPIKKEKRALHARKKKERKLILSYMAHRIF